MRFRKGLGTSGLRRTQAQLPQYRLKRWLPLPGCRWNTLAAHDTGLTLQLLPMLLGFFTYKAAVIAKAAASLAADLMPARVEPSDGASPAKETSQPSQQEQNYNQKILTQ